MKQARKLLKVWVAFAVALLCWHAAVAQEVMVDPTRPPSPGILSGAVRLNSGPQLQSVIITSTERSAIIGGERIKLGGKYGVSRVVKITESEVVLRSASGNETLRLYPDIEMKPPRATAVGN